MTADPVVVRPEKPITETIARVSLPADNLIRLNFPEKRDEMREIMKRLRYVWQWPNWERTLKQWNGRLPDRAAELCHHLLAAGFCVAPPSDQVRDMAITGQYEPECRRWVLARKNGEHKGWLVIWWARGEDCYAPAIKVAGSRYDKPCVVVPPEHYEEVLDFAEMYGFRVSDAAEQLIGQARARRDAALIVSVPPVAKREQAAANGRPRLVEPERVEIDDELADDLVRSPAAAG